MYEGLAAELPDVDPTADQLAAIAEQWPLLEAEIELLDARSMALDSGDEREGERRLRRARRRLLAVRLTRQIARTSRRKPVSPRRVRRLSRSDD